jgi:Tfp pilus assembly protein PilF
MTTENEALDQLDEPDGTGKAAPPSPPESPEATPHSGTGIIVLHVLAIVVATGLVFANTLKNSYQLDDAYRIKDNPALEQVWPPWRHFLDPRTSTTLPKLVQFRPLLPLTLSIDFAIADYLKVDRLVANHVGNILIHGLSAILLYLLFVELLTHWPRRKFKEDRGPPREPAFWAALFFAVHPVSGVPVNYLCSRDLLLMMFFATWALLAYVRMRRKGGNPLHWVLVILLLVLSMCSKTNAVVFPSLILFFELLLVGSRLLHWKVWLRILPFVIVVVGFFVYTKVALNFSDVDNVVIERASRLEYPLTQARVHTFYYLRNIVWPFEIRPRPHIDAVTSFADLRMLLGAFIILASLYLCWHIRRTAPIVAFCIMCYWLFFAPTSSIVALRSMATDYRQYPSLGFLFLALSLLVFFLVKTRLRLLVFGCLLGWFTWTSVQMNRLWIDNETLWEQSVKYGGSALSYLNYGVALMTHDGPAAEKQFKHALEMSPDYVFVHINLGTLYVHQGRTEEGLSHLARAVKINPSWAVSYFWQAKGLLRAGKIWEAAAAATQAVTLDPRVPSYQELANHIFALAAGNASQISSSNDWLALFKAGFAHQQAGKNELAIELYLEFLETQPNYTQANFNLAYAYMQTNQPATAIPYFKKALALKSTYLEAHLHLSTCYGEVGNIVEAARHKQLHDEWPRQRKDSPSHTYRSPNRLGPFQLDSDTPFATDTPGTENP